MSILHEGLLMHENGTVNSNLGLDHFCKGKHVKILHRRYGYINPDSNGKLKEWPAINPGDRSTLSLMIPYDWEILKVFIENNDILPQWIVRKHNFSYEAEEDSFNKTTGLWTGKSGMIQRGEVDFSANLGADGFKTVELGQGLHYSAPVMSIKWHWHSRLPVELSLTWNLLYLFPKE